MTAGGDAFDNEGSCIELFPQSEELKGSYFMFLDGKLSRISVVESAIATPRGIAVGSDRRRGPDAYGEKLQAEPHHYLDLPAEYLTYWLKPEARGVRFDGRGAQGADHPCRERQHPADRGLRLAGHRAQSRSRFTGNES